MTGIPYGTRDKILAGIEARLTTEANEGNKGMRFGADSGNVYDVRRQGDLVRFQIASGKLYPAWAWPQTVNLAMRATNALQLGVWLVAMADPEGKETERMLKEIRK